MQFKDIELRALEPEDLELLYEWENNDSYWVLSNTITPYSRYILKKYLEDSHKNIYETGQLRLMIDYKPEKVTIGTIDIFDFDPFNKRAGLGILIADENYRRKGLASMSLTCVIDYCFKTLQLHQLFCNILVSNTESVELFKKHGFVLSGEKRDWIKTSGRYLNEYIFQLINPKDSF